MGSGHIKDPMHISQVKCPSVLPPSPLWQRSVFVSIKCEYGRLNYYFKHINQNTISCTVLLLFRMYNELFKQLIIEMVVKKIVIAFYFRFKLTWRLNVIQRMCLLVHLFLMSKRPFNWLNVQTNWWELSNSGDIQCIDLMRTLTCLYKHFNILILNYSNISLNHILHDISPSCIFDKKSTLFI